MCVLCRLPGLGANCWNVSRRRFELKQASVAPSTFRQAARMADERPPNLAQSIVGYFDTGTSNKVLGALALGREIKSYYADSESVSYLNINFSLTVD